MHKTVVLAAVLLGAVIILASPSSVARAADASGEPVAMQADLSAEDLQQLALAHYRSGDYEAAEQSFRQAAMASIETHTAFHPLTAVILSQLGQVLARRENFEDALYFSSTARDVYLHLNGPDDWRAGSERARIADLLLSRGDILGALSEVRLGMNAIRAALRPEDPDYIRALSTFAQVHRQAGQLIEAEAAYRELLAIPQQDGDADRKRTQVLNGLALTLSSQGRHNEAEAAFREVIELDRAVWGEEHVETALAMANLAGVLTDTGRYGEAEVLLRRVIDFQRKAPDDERISMALSMTALGSVLALQTGRNDEARQLYHSALAALESTVGRDHTMTAPTLNNLALLAADSGRYEEAERLNREVLDIYEGQLPDDHPLLATARNNLASNLTATGRNDEAIALYGQVISSQRALASQFPGVRNDLARVLHNLAVLQFRTGHHAEAAVLMRESGGLWLAVWCPANRDNATSGLSNGPESAPWGRSQDCRGHPELTVFTGVLASMRGERRPGSPAAVRLFAHASQMTLGRTRLAYAFDREARREYDRFRQLHGDFVSAAWASRSPETAQGIAQGLGQRYGL